MRPRVEGQTIDGADLSLRDRGSNRLAAAPIGTIGYFSVRDRRILLIHGYNVAERSGQNAMAQLRHALIEGCPALAEQILTITWPGNESWLRGGAAAYFAKVETARAAGRLLYENLIAEHRHQLGSRELVIVAHSLGCRVTLEFLRHLDRSARPPGLEKILVILMAAAVPTGLSDLFDAAHRNADKIVVLHSVDDMVLKSFFRVGQWMAGEGSFPEALGHAGNPHHPPWSYHRQMTGYGHGDYWAGAPTADVIGEQLDAHFADVTYRSKNERFPLVQKPTLDEVGYLSEHYLSQ